MTPCLHLKVGSSRSTTLYSFLYVHIVKVKWGKERYDDVELNTDEAPEVFKTQLYTLTGVPPERQKVMISGAMITVRRVVN